VSTEYYLVLAVLLFCVGIVGFLIRRNALISFMSIELMLNACNLALIAFSNQFGDLAGQTASFFVMVVAAAEVVVGLAIILTVFRTRHSSSVDETNLLRR
jgi:NADH-quinone oxidoreductase subunit K